VKYELFSIKLVTLWVLICWHDSSYKEQLREMRELGNKKKRSNLVGISFSLVSLTSGNFELVRLYPYVIFTPRILIWCWFHRLCFFFFFGLCFDWIFACLSTSISFSTLARWCLF
jgi:hypothetical protein